MNSISNQDYCGSSASSRRITETRNLRRDTWTTQKKMLHVKRHCIEQHIPDISFDHWKARLPIVC